MLKTIEKLEQRIMELQGHRHVGDHKGYRYRDIRDLEEFKIREDVSGIPNPAIPELNDMDASFHQGDSWKGRDHYLWLQKKVVLPEEWRHVGPKKRVVGVFDFGITGGGNNYGFESMLYIEGKPYQAVDGNHKEVFFKKEHFGHEITLTFRLWSGIEGGGPPRELVHCYQDAFLSLLDEATDDLYYMSDMMLQTAKILSEQNVEYHEIVEALEDAYRCIDWSNPGSLEFYESIKEADDVLNNHVNHMEKYSKVLISCVGHTHIDTAWLWRLKHAREKASRSFSSVLRLMEEFPEYYFLHTQPQQYEYIKEDFPEIYAQIKERVKEGRWEIDGGMWVEADCNIPSGESLVRQLLLGRKFMVEEFEKEPQYLWLPDVFGYSWALPQILKKSGINTFMTTKISWNQYNRMPNDTFWWKGIDGSEVLTHFITTPIPGQGKEDYYATYNGELFPDTVQGAWEQYREKRLNKEILLSYGYGDGGGGVNRDMLERRRRLDRIPGLPNVKTTKAGDYFKRLQNTVENTNQQMAKWDGELYLELHRGTYTSQGYNKKTNRRMEELYRRAEWLTVMAAMSAGKLDEAQQEKLTEGWKIVLTHQFHDIIPGSSIHEVYEDSAVNYKKAEKIAREVIESSLNKLVKPSDSVISIVNEMSETRSGMVWLEGLGDSIIHTKDGKIVPMQQEKNGTWVYVEDVPAMGSKKLYLAEGTYCSKDVCAVILNEESQRMEIETPYYQIILNEAGQIDKLYDKEQECEILAKGACGNVLQLFEDKPIAFDNWDIDIYYDQKKEEVTELQERLLLENGPLRTVIRQVWKFRQSCISQDMILYTNDRRIDFKTHVDWQETQKLLKVAFPVDIRTNYATYDIQYGNVRRPNNSNTSWERARFESVAHRWADLSEYGYGVSLLNNCKYGYDIHDNVIRLSLLKAGIYPDYAADKGEHDFTYALLPHKGDFVQGSTVKEAFDLNQPLIALRGEIDLCSNVQGSTIFLNGNHLEIDAFKKSEDGKTVLVRFHEYAGAKGTVTIETGFQIKTFAECDLMERPIEEFRTGEMKFDIKPYEIKTILIQV